MLQSFSPAPLYFLENPKEIYRVVFKWLLKCLRLREGPCEPARRRRGGHRRGRARAAGPATARGQARAAEGAAAAGRKRRPLAHHDDAVVTRRAGRRQLCETTCGTTKALYYIERRIGREQLVCASCEGSGGPRRPCHRQACPDGATRPSSRPAHPREDGHSRCSGSAGSGSCGRPGGQLEWLSAVRSGLKGQALVSVEQFSTGCRWQAQPAGLLLPGCCCWQQQR